MNTILMNLILAVILFVALMSTFTTMFDFFQALINKSGKVHWLGTCLIWSIFFFVYHLKI